MQIADRAAVGEITANQKRMLGLDRYVEFPIAKRRLGNGKVRTRSRRPRCGTSRQADWDEIEIFQELTVRHRDRAGNVSAIKWPGDFDIGVSPRRERVVARDQCAVRFQLKIQARRCQCRKCYAAGDLEMSAGKFASKLLDRERVPRKIQARLEILARRQRWLGHARDVDGHAAAPTETRTPG